MTLTQQQAEWSVLKDNIQVCLTLADTPKMRVVLTDALELAEEMESRVRVQRRREVGL